jgi:putative lipoic acid-binding regulatory protein
MKKRSSLIVFILLLSVVSCTREKPALQKIGEVKFAIDDSVDINPDFRYYFEENTHRQILYAPSKWRKSIDIYDLSKPSQIINIRFTNTGNYLSVYIHNFDSIFVIDENRSELFISDFNGNILHKWDLNNALKDKDSIYSAYSFGTTPIYYYNNKVFQNIGGSGSPDEFYRKYCLLIYDIKDTTFRKSVNFPAIYQQGKDYLRSAATHCIAENMLVYSFEFDHNIYLYDLNGNLTKKIYRKSQYLDKFAEADSSKTRYHGYDTRFRIENGEYFNIIYDKYQQLFYRIVRHNMSMVDSNGKVNDNIDGKWSIIIKDKNFNVLTEQVFPEKIYNIYNIIPTKAGLLISTYNKNNSQYNKNVYSFDVFKFIK